MEKKERIGTGGAIILVIFAALFDIISLIPVIDVAVAIFGQMLMALFFFLEGVNVLSAKRAVAFASGSIVEVIPGISILPGFTVETIAIILLTRAEDKAKNAVAANQAS